MEKKYNWFRVYNSMVDNEKLRLLAFEDRWHYVAILCLKSEGLLDQEASELRERKIAVKLGLTIREADEVKRRLREVELVDDNWQPSNWETKQFKSDTSTDRVRQYRQRQAEKTEWDGIGRNETLTKRSRNVSVTPPDTDTETYTETEEKNSRQKATPPALLKSDQCELYREFANRMWASIQPLTNQKKTPNLDAWADEIRKLVEIDAQPPETVWQVFKWANADDFWKGNILSAATLRKQFPKLFAQSRKDAPVDYSKMAREVEIAF